VTILTKEQRTFLDATVQKARTQSEAAAAHAIRRLTVTDARPGAHLSEPERALRRELRSKATQLGDTADSDTAPLLIADIGYEQWHRLLFARFLEVNGLLRHPGMGIPLTLEDCSELAEELGEPDAWSVAARFASEILPGVFRLTDPSVLVRYAREDLAALETLLASIPEETLRAEDALGWVYQFWQTAQKMAVNESGRKIGGADISPVTQLFTENYMVRFLLENSLGAWWAGKHPDSPLLANWEYLRRVEDGTPAVGTFGDWPSTVAEVTVMDPCCGSGHFLIAAFGMLWRMRAEEENLSVADAQDAVLRDNIFGLELDPRCTQIAAFNLILEARKSSHDRPTPQPRIVCSGTSIRPSIQAWRSVVDNDDERVLETLSFLHSMFSDADSLGSLIDPTAASRTGTLLELDRANLTDTLSTIASLSESDSETERSVLGDISSAIGLLMRKYTLVVTNVPYLSRTKQNSVLRDFANQWHPASKGDLSTMFIDRLRSFSSCGTIAAVTPAAWTELSRYRQFREDLLGTTRLQILAKLGRGAFTAISGEVVNAIMIIDSAGLPLFAEIGDAVKASGDQGSSRSADFRPHEQRLFVRNPDSRLTILDTNFRQDYR